MSTPTQPVPQKPEVLRNFEDNPQTIFDLIAKQQQQLDRMMVTVKLMEITDVEVKMGGYTEKILNQEVITEHTNANSTKYMVKIASYRDAYRRVFHLKDIDEVPLVGYMHDQIIIKMKSHKRKGEHGIINAIRNEPSGTEVIPTAQRRKKFLGMI